MKMRKDDRPSFRSTLTIPPASRSLLPAPSF